MLSRKKLIECVDTMVSNFYSEKEPCFIRLKHFQVWLTCSFIAGLIDIEDYDYIQAHGYNKIEKMDDYE